MLHTAQLFVVLIALSSASALPSRSRFGRAEWSSTNDTSASASADEASTPSAAAASEASTEDVPWWKTWNSGAESTSESSAVPTSTTEEAVSTAETSASTSSEDVPWWQTWNQPASTASPSASSSTEDVPWWQTWNQAASSTSESAVPSPSAVTESDVGSIETIPLKRSLGLGKRAGWDGWVDAYGCYGDSTSNRALRGTSKTNWNGMTIEMCFDFCLAANYRGAGVENGNACYCDNQITYSTSSSQTWGKTTAASNCNVPCSGNSQQLCGGKDGTAVYIYVYRPEVAASSTSSSLAAYSASSSSLAAYSQSAAAFSASTSAAAFSSASSLAAYSQSVSNAAAASKSASLAAYSASTSAAAYSQAAAAYSQSAAAYSQSTSLAAYSANAAAYSQSSAAAAQSAAAYSQSTSLAAYSANAAAYSQSSSAAAASAASSLAAYSQKAAAYSQSAAAYSQSTSLAAYSANAAAYSQSSSAAAQSAAAYSQSTSLAAYSANAAAYSQSSSAAAQSAAAYSQSTSLAAYSANAAAYSQSAAAYSQSSAAAASAAAYSASQSAAAYSASTSLAAYSANAAAYSQSSSAAAQSASASLAAYSAKAAAYSQSAASYSAAQSAAAYSQSAAAYSQSVAAYSAAQSQSAYSQSAAAYSAAQSQAAAASSAAAYSQSVAAYSAAQSSQAAYSQSVAAYSAAQSQAAYSQSVAAYSAAQSQAAAASVAAYSASASLAAYSQSVNNAAAASSAAAYSASASLAAYSQAVNNAAASSSAAAYSASVSAAAYSSSSAAAAAQATPGSTPPVLASGWSVADSSCIAEGQTGRALVDSGYSAGDMTPKQCTQHCADGGYTIAGVEYGGECFCGTILSNGASLDKTSNACTMTCTGDKTALCGGPNALQLFIDTAKAHGTLNKQMTALVQDLPSGWSAASTSCIAEGTTGRALSGASTQGSDMTVAKCLNYCQGQGFLYAGVEYGSECYCGNSLGGGASLNLPSTTCSMHCSGDPGTICGGPNGLQLYTNPANAKTATLPSGWSAASTSCIAEGSRGRALTGAMTAADNMTPQVCLAFCQTKGFQYAGIEYSRECYCGNTLDNGASLSTPSSSCNMACAGDNSQTCGGPGALTLFSNPSNAPSNSAVNGFVSKGCVQEVDGRALRGAFTSADDMTIDKCTSFCASKGFSMAGVEYGAECFCDNSFQGGASLDLISGQCVMPCPGNSKTMCGGPNAIQLYSTN